MKRNREKETERKKGVHRLAETFRSDWTLRSQSSELEELFSINTWKMADIRMQFVQILKYLRAT